MTPVLLPELAAKSVVIAGATLGLLALTRHRSAAERSWLAHAGLAVLVATPAAGLLLPRLRLLAPREAAEMLGQEAALAMPSPTIEPAIWLPALYMAGAGLLIFMTLVAVARLFVLRRQASVLVDAGWLTALARAQQRMGVKSGAALLVSSAVTSPVSWGLARPTIVLNEGLVASRDDAEAVIAHELAHVARLDWAKLVAARVVVALFWFNPLVWILAGQCHQLREEAADDAVLRGDVAGPDYAALLVEAARHESRGGLIAAHGVAPGKGSLHRRVTRVLDAAARRTPTGAGWALGWLIGAVVLTAPLAAATVERAEPSAATIRSASDAGRPPEPIVTPRYPEGATRPPPPIVQPRATTIPPRPKVDPRPMDRVTTPPPIVVQRDKTQRTLPPPIVTPRKAAPPAPANAVSIPARKAQAAQVSANARAYDLQRAEERARDKRAEAQGRELEKQAEATARQVEARKRQSEPRVRVETRTFTSVDGEARTLVKRSAEGTKSVTIAADGAVRMEKPGKTMVLRPVTTTAPLTKADIARIEAEAASTVANTSTTP